MASWEDPFEILDVDEEATQQEVESSFRKKALSCHPDRHPDDPTARARFDKLSRAKETLLDPATREAALRRRHGVDPSTGEVAQRKGPAPGQWMEGRGFRARAPDEQKRAENERIQKADEEAFKRYQAQRRAQAQEFLKESTGGCLGGGSVGLQEARQAFAQRLEQESDPKMRRRQRAEEEKRRREAERQEREEEERRKLQAWNERERARASKNRNINEAKSAHWQNWAESQGSAAGPEDAGVTVSSNPIVGTWLYGKQPNQYRIVERSDNSCCFDGPNPTGPGRLRGTLAATGDWYEAVIAYPSGEPFGTMRFLFVDSEDGDEALISQCRKAGSEEWGREVFASRAGAQPSRQPAAAAAFPEPEQQPCEAVAFDLSIHLIVDRALGLSMDMVVRRGTTVLGLKERLAAEDPTGSTSPSSFVLAMPNPDDSLMSRPPLPDETVLLEEHEQLEVRQVESQEDAGEEGGPSVVDQDLHVPPPAAESALLEWLKGIRLEAYHEEIVKNGFEQLEDIQAMPLPKLEELANLAGMKLGHAVRFRKAVKDLTGVA